MTDAEEQDPIHFFYACMVMELYITVDRELHNSPSDQAEAWKMAFEQVFRRCDFENHRVVASASYEVNVPRDKLNPTLIAIAFGNFLATKGIILSDQILGLDH